MHSMSIAEVNLEWSIKWTLADSRAMHLLQSLVSRFECKLCAREVPLRIDRSALLEALTGYVAVDYVN